MSTVKKITSTEPPFRFEAYAHVISPIPKEDGGGYMLSVPDIPGCMADGETELEAIENGRDAFLAVVSALADMGRPIPAPMFTPKAGNKAHA